MSCAREFGPAVVHMSHVVAPTKGISQYRTADISHAHHSPVMKAGVTIARSVVTTRRQRTSSSALLTAYE